MAASQGSVAQPNTVDPVLAQRGGQHHGHRPAIAGSQERFRPADGLRTRLTALPDLAEPPNVEDSPSM